MIIALPELSYLFLANIVYPCGGVLFITGRFHRIFCTALHFLSGNFSLLKTNWLTLLSRLLIGTRGLVGGRDRLDVYITYCYCT